MKGSVAPGMSKLTSNMGVQIPQLSTLTFVFYILFLLEVLLHLSARIPGFGVLRPTLLFTMGTLGLVLMQSSITKKREVSEVGNALKYLMIYMLVSLPLVEFPGSVIRENWQVFLKAVVFFYFTSAIVDSPKRFKIFLFIFISCQVVRVLEPLYLHVTDGYWGSHTHLGGGEFANRLAGAPKDIINANELGFIIATCVTFLHFLLFPRGLKSKLLYAALMVALLYALILTMSRGAFLALVVVGWMAFKESNNKAMLVVVCVIGLVAAWSVMSPDQKDRYLSLVDDDAAGAKTRDGRLNGMVNGFILGFENPIVGHGLGTTGEAKYHKYGKYQASHNMYSELFIEIGLIGMALYLKFMVAVYREVKRVRAIVSPNNFEIVQMSKVITALFFMYALYSLNYWGLSQGYWYLLAGLAAAFVRIVKMQAGNDLYAPLLDKKKLT